MKVGEVMTKHPLVVDLNTPVRVAADLMRSKGIRHLPVVDAGAHVLGIVTDRDLRHAAFLPALAEQTGPAPPHVSDPEPVAAAAPQTRGAGPRGRERWRGWSCLGDGSLP